MSATPSTVSEASCCAPMPGQLEPIQDGVHEISSSSVPPTSLRGAIGHTSSSAHAWSVELSRGRAFTALVRFGREAWSAPLLPCRAQSASRRRRNTSAPRSPGESSESRPTRLRHLLKIHAQHSAPSMDWNTPALDRDQIHAPRFMRIVQRSLHASSSGKRSGGSPRFRQRQI